MKNKSEKEKKKMPLLKKLCIIGASVIAAVLVICLIISNVLYSFALDRNSKLNVEKMIVKMVVPQGGKGGASSTAGSIEYSGFGGGAEIKEWFNSVSTDEYITSDDGLKLHAYYIPNKNEYKNANGNYVLLCHGYTSKASDMARYADKFYRMGYGILAPDARAHGESEGHIRGMGWLERRDIVKWADYLVDKAGSSIKIALFGVSMGGATVMMTSGEDDLPENVTVVVEDCGYSSVWDEFAINMNNMFHLPTFPLLNIASKVCDIRAGYGLKEASAAEQLKKSTLPILFIHGSSDTFVPFEMIEICYEASASPVKEKLVIEGANHASSSMKEPDTYWAKVEEFVNTNIR